MNALLDTNIIIHRENDKVTNQSIGSLFFWLDKLNYKKLVHPKSLEELKKYKNKDREEAIAVKTQSYFVHEGYREPDEAFLEIIKDAKQSDNNYIDNCLLYELYINHVDCLITEDRGIHRKSRLLGISDRVFTIEEFIEKAIEDHPELRDYKALSVKKTLFGKIDHKKDPFFSSLRASYAGFDNWFDKKCDEEAYVCLSEENNIQGFLYIKLEEENENYKDIYPPFTPKRRLKIGTFKVDSTGYRLGERFLQIAFENASLFNVDEIYVTLYTDRDELKILEGLLSDWGFIQYGYKINYDTGKQEKVLVKKLNVYDESQSVKFNFPNLKYRVGKYIIPIKPEYHTDLFPDSQLNTENKNDFKDYRAHRYALQKVYVTQFKSIRAKAGDLVLFYRIGEEDSGKVKKYSSVLTTLCVIDTIHKNIKDEETFLNLCKNRSVFSQDDLKEMWKKNKKRIMVIRFIYIASLEKRPILNFLWENNIIASGTGPRVLTAISDEQFDLIMNKSETDIRYVEELK